MPGLYRLAIVELFENGDDAGCDVVFCLEKDVPEERKWKRPRVSERSKDDSAATVGGDCLGLPLPAHLLILRLASPRFRAQIARWNVNTSDRAAQEAAASSSCSAPCRPQLRVPLGSEAEAPFARAAIGYAYTGRVAADSVREVLEVRWQASYLEINGCMAACDELLVGMLAAGSSSDVGLVGQAVAAAPVDRPARPVEFMLCGALLPDPAADPSFGPVLVAAKEALVRHFGDTLVVLNTPSLRQQLLQLPAIVVEALLGSDSFGTDSEDTVLLLLATWMKANHSQTDAATRERLCRLVRLVQLGRPYLTAVLPALAADHETREGSSHCAWFPISVTEASFIAALATASAGMEKQQFLSHGRRVYDMQSAWYSTARRPQCLSGAGRGCEWAVSQQELLQKLGELKPGITKRLHGSFPNGSPCARGFEFKTFLEVAYAAAAARLDLWCCMPAAYDMPGSRLGSGGKAAAVVGLDLCLTVHHWSGSVRQDAFKGEFEAAVPELLARPSGHLSGVGWASALPLGQPQPAAGVGGEALVGWAAYVREGRLTGTLTLLPPP
ncbi:hypothetical protein TSOC_002506 [Tetrabaena socialis]|uniref:BACK domain-containing protein n=1 Tax=Tetrabaena socialis TaxID=47790 RepID=A0A2J8ADX2_9CHLO|nr:hypothetical protein TSOC_002506 [Tetrabaena socialis]|eukprot:PNH10709.1 hypothetical protein TSOC_002506 [Tetrabaena socialis]